MNTDLPIFLCVSTDNSGGGLTFFDNFDVFDGTTNCSTPISSEVMPLYVYAGSGTCTGGLTTFGARIESPYPVGELVDGALLFESVDNCIASSATSGSVVNALTICDNTDYFGLPAICINGTATVSAYRTLVQLNSSSAYTQIIHVGRSSGSTPIYIAADGFWMVGKYYSPAGSDVSWDNLLPGEAKASCEDDVSWLSIGNPWSGTGNGTITLSWSANTTGYPRGAGVIVNDKLYVIQQGTS
jgi:hypothetical protein